MSPARSQPGRLAPNGPRSARTTIRRSTGWASGLVATGWSVPDDLVEAIELPERSFTVGFMWHPEELRDGAPFRALAAAAMRQGVPA